MGAMFVYPKRYEVIVVGGGHAGTEAALAAARMGCRTLLLSINLDSVGQMSCNPAVGGLAKGHLAREVDAMGGEMGKNTDMTGMQFRMLNRKKGPAVWGPRAQCDKKAYQFRLKWICERQPNLDCKQGQVARLLVKDRCAYGVATTLGVEFHGQTVILTTGTFLRGLMHIGLSQQSGGRAGEGAAMELSGCLKEIGLELGRLKTGTPPRLLRQSIDFSKLEMQPGDEPVPWFTYWKEDLFQTDLAGASVPRGTISQDDSATPLGSQSGNCSPSPVGRERAGVRAPSDLPSAAKDSLHPHPSPLPSDGRGRTDHALDAERCPELVNPAVGAEQSAELLSPAILLCTGDTTAPSVPRGTVSPDDLATAPCSLRRTCSPSPVGRERAGVRAVSDTPSAAEDSLHPHPSPLPSDGRGRADDALHAERCPELVNPAVGAEQSAELLSSAILLCTGDTTAPSVPPRTISPDDLATAPCSLRRTCSPSPVGRERAGVLASATHPPGSILSQLGRQIPCYITFTTERTAEIIRASLHKSPLYAGVIEGVGPRYCPSIEDKIVKFPNKKRQQLFLEPEGIATDEIYVNGFSTSLPFDVQVALVRTIVGCEQAEIMRPAYAVEYDFVYPTQLYASLETKVCQNLYLAGQINGTSGYEEAAAQGLMAGINAARRTQGKEPIVLRRDQAYIGVLIDDLVTRGTSEPYRMFTSRAEYRLILRQDNADLRLCTLAYEVGLLPAQNYRRFLAKRDAVANELARLAMTRVGSETLAQILRRPEITYHDMPGADPNVNSEVAEQVQIETKYEGYIQRQQADIERFRGIEEKRIPADFDYDQVPSLRNEARQKLGRIRPATLGQAARISGVSPSDISIITIWLKRGSGDRT
jgi:tRNA U34 5-carboxymethylaminomethyl modifying enzyme MnmG/GidA